MKSIENKFNDDVLRCDHCKVTSRHIWHNYSTHGTENINYVENEKLNTSEEIKLKGERTYESDIPEDVFERMAQVLKKEIILYENRFSIAICQNCSKFSIWVKEEKIYPQQSTIEDPANNMPEDVKKDYNEAREVLSKSPRSSAALLRLAIQKLCKHLGGNGKNINDDIKKLVQNGLHEEIKKALDIVRVVGNESVHPGLINLDDDTEMAEYLFELVNLIVEEMITGPSKLNKFYNKLPKNKLKQIDDRDGKTKI